MVIMERMEITIQIMVFVRIVDTKKMDKKENGIAM